MKLKLALAALSLLAVLATAMPAMAAPPTAFTVPYHQAQFQWRSAPWGGPFGAWSWGYQNYATSSDFNLTANVLHTIITYSPPVIPLGNSSVYVYSKKAGVWIQHEGTVNYTSPYSGLPITEYWRGYLNFAGTPSATSFVHGVGYQWGYVYGVDGATVLASYPHAVWDNVMQAWLVGFSIYLWDPITTTQSYTIPFPSPFIEPVSADNYNPLGL